MRWLSSESPNARYQSASTSSDVGPYRCRKSTLGTLPCCTSFGKTSMKPSSMELPVAL